MSQANSPPQSNQSNENYWRKCSTCKKPIALLGKYYVCSVSTCNGQRTGYVFCTIQCFEVHLPGARHKDAGAVEKVAPRIPESQNVDPTSSTSRATSTSTSNASTTATGSMTTSAVGSAASTMPGSPARQPARVLSQAPSSARTSVSSTLPREVLVIASRLKEYVTARSDFNTSGQVMDVLSDHLRIVVDRAIDNARAEGRKTVLDRDFEFLKR